jgi:TrmH family RNA methyltransferase
VRRSEGAFVVEGTKLVTGALDAGAAIEAVFFDPAAGAVPTVTMLLQRVEDGGARVFPLGQGVLERIADTVTPQPVIAIVGTPRASLDSVGTATFLVVCVDVRDPGNAGTVIRIADAAGADGVVFCAGTVDPFNPKTVRAAAGSVLHLPIVDDVDARDVLVWLAQVGLRRLGAMPRGGTAYESVDWTVPCALVLGNEASGLPASLDGMIDDHVTIPMAGRAESLNVSSAASVLCFEARRQRNNLHPVIGSTVANEAGNRP